MRKGTTWSAIAFAAVLGLGLAGCVVNTIGAQTDTSLPTNTSPNEDMASTMESTTTITSEPVEGTAPDQTFEMDISPGNGRIVIVGDSLTLGADRHGRLVSRLEEMGWATSIDAVEGRTTPQGVAALEQMLAVNPEPDTVVVGLGTNDREVPQDFRPLVERVVEMTEGSRLLWMAIEWEPRSQLQDVLDEYEARGELTLIDFRPVMAAHPELVGFDGIHFTEEGYAARAETMVDAIGEP